MKEQIQKKIREALDENFKGFNSEAKMFRHIYQDMVKIDNYLEDLSKEKDFKESYKKFKEALSKDLKFITLK